MAEFTSVAPQTVAAGQAAVLTETPVRGNGCIDHRQGSGLVALRGLTGQCRAQYKVEFFGNIAIPTGGTVGPVSVALSLNGEALPATLAVVTPAAVEDLWHVSGGVFVDVPRGCCASVAVVNTSGQAITVANLNVIATRTA